MRRGHSGIGGWRNENTRHFRPRGGGNPYFRPRDYALLDAPRFPPPNLRSHRPPPFVSRSTHIIDHNVEHNRPRYRYDNRRNQNRPFEKHSSSRQMFPQSQTFKHIESPRHPKIISDSNYYDNTKQRDGYHVNSHGDVDHRQSNIGVSHLNYVQQPVSTWAHSSEQKEYDDENKKPSRQHEGVKKKTLLDYPGHRPPSSDHYGGNPTLTIDNSNSFSRSVDDTVNIVRKRLLDRNESLHTSDSLITDNDNNDPHEENFLSNYDIQQEQPTRRRIQKLRQKDKSNCDKIKNNIVHQLFKMDKEKIHKLMDNPNSSSKFEYAISSLITESQNSFNRHLRSVAEKSLSSTSTDFIENDNNTIYEDTFLKQMQCLLDPQDTVFLEDIKPIVMAELSKVLQLDDFEQQCVDNEINENNVNEDQSEYEQYKFLTSNNCETFSEDNISKEQQYVQEEFQTPNIRKMASETCRDYDKFQTTNKVLPKSLFDRRQRTKSCTYIEERDPVTENIRYSRHSLDNQSNENIYKNLDNPSALFDSSFEHVSEEEDPFAELDNQYHVAVDHNFIATEDASSPQQLQKDDLVKTPFVNTLLPTSENNSINNIKQEIENQILDIAKSPLKLSLSYNNKDNINDRENKNTNIEQDRLNLIETLNTNTSHYMEETPITSDNNASVDSMESPSSCVIPKSLTSSNSRKRPIDQQSSHRKEKRKKVSNDLKTSEKNDSGKSLTNLSSKNDTDTKSKELCKETKKSETIDKEYSDKYVKRKNAQNESKAKSITPKKKHNSVSSCYSNTNLKNDTAINPSKTDPKNILKTIDMFTEKPKKVNIHQAHRNTAIIPSVSNVNTNMDQSDKKKKSSNSIKTKRHIGTQVFKRQFSKDTQTIENNFCTRFCQTEIEKSCSQEVQTDPVRIERYTCATDAFERMKEIDLEIQVLLQEKFKLYSSLENKESSKNSLQTLGMTVLNVTPFDEDIKVDDVDTVEDSFSGVAIVDDFTNIPVEELEQIDFETVQTDSNESFNIGKRKRRQTTIEQEAKKSNIPKTTRRLNKRGKAPNISLIEQIITDDRPLEDIIAIDDFEKPLKTKNKTSKVQQTKKRLSKKTRTLNLDEINIIEIKECSVVLVREDLNKLLIQNAAEHCAYHETLCEPLEYTNVVQEVEITEKENSDLNDLQFDMLDVSEDIVIGDSCDIKSLQDKELVTLEVPISEELILDNTQTYEEVTAPQALVGDSECKMYDYSADENLCHDTITVTGNADAVLAIECIENNFIAACLDGNVYYFSGDGQLINTLRGSNLAVTCLTIVKDKYETTVYTGSLDSRIRYYDLETGIEKGPECNVLSPIQTMDRAWDTVFVGTRTGFVLQFECKNNMLIPVSTVKFSDQSILALRAMKEGPRKVLLVAARSEDVTIKDAQTGLLLRTLVGPKMTVYTLLYEDGKVYCGTSSHQIQVFDYTSGVHVGAHEGGKGAVCLRASGGLLFAGCYDGCVYVYREGEPQPMAQLRGPGLMLLSLAIVGSKIIAGYKDRSLYIWKIPLSILQEMIL
ncbi:putative autophagy-related protein 11 [Battus philenor]|uniref:putative autophagy-related protein 11 n=1 Tax=Battus philenor TaxID=42288 RepID=UPI0035CEF907